MTDEEILQSVSREAIEAVAEMVRVGITPERVRGIERWAEMRLPKHLRGKYVGRIGMLEEKREIVFAFQQKPEPEAQPITFRSEFLGHFRSVGPGRR